MLFLGHEKSKMPLLKKNKKHTPFQSVGHPQLTGMGYGSWSLILIIQITKKHYSHQVLD
jgi:hypothetical protein